MLAIPNHLTGETFDNIPVHKRNLGPLQTPSRRHQSSHRPVHDSGLTSATFIIFNAALGTGLVSVPLGQRLLIHRRIGFFATPSVILTSAGSVCMALIMWLLGAAFAATGSSVYLKYGTVSPLLPSGAIAYVPPRDTCYEEWKNKDEKLPKKVFEEYYRTLPKDEKEVYHTPSVLVLSDASCRDSHTSHGQRLFEYVTVALFVHYIISWHVPQAPT